VWSRKSRDGSDGRRPRPASLCMRTDRAGRSKGEVWDSTRLLGPSPGTGLSHPAGRMVRFRTDVSWILDRDLRGAWFVFASTYPRSLTETCGAHGSFSHRRNYHAKNELARCEFVSAVLVSWIRDRGLRGASSFPQLSYPGFGTGACAARLALEVRPLHGMLSGVPLAWPVSGGRGGRSTGGASGTQRGRSTGGASGTQRGRSTGGASGTQRESLWKSCPFMGCFPGCHWLCQCLGAGAAGALAEPVAPRRTLFRATHFFVSARTTNHGTRRALS
jgi:hypothetical protein